MSKLDESVRVNTSEQEAADTSANQPTDPETPYDVARQQKASPIPKSSPRPSPSDPDYAYHVVDFGIEVWVPTQMWVPTEQFVHPITAARGSPEKAAYNAVMCGSALSHSQMMLMIRFLKDFHGVKTVIPAGVLPSVTESLSRRRLQVVQAIAQAFWSESGIDPY